VQIFELGAAMARLVRKRPRGSARLGLSENDGELLRRCREGDQDAWRELVGRHTRKVFAVAYRFSGRVGEAEDLTQEVFVKVYQSLSRFDANAGAFPAWLMTIARNHAIDHYRSIREERARADDDAERLEAFPARSEAQDDALEREERAQLVRRALRALPNDLREALVLCDLQGLAYEEIAASRRLPLGTVKSRINRARLELAKRLLHRRRELLPES